MSRRGARASGGKAGSAYSPVFRGLLGLVACALTSGCDAPRPAAVKAAAAPLPPSHFVDEWFPLADARCRVHTVERALTEPLRHTPGRVPEDLPVLDLSLACERADGTRVSPRGLLTQAEVRWLDDRGIAHPLLGDTKLEEQTQDHLAFAVAPEHDGLARPRRYDARDGEPSGPRERGRARLLIERGKERVQVAPFPRARVQGLDAFIDTLARTLAREAPFESLTKTPEGHASLERASELFRHARDVLSGHTLRVRRIAQQEGQERLTLSLDGGEARSPRTLAEFEFELESPPSGSPSVLRWLDPESTRERVECAEQTRELAARAAERRASGSDATRCNALGTLLPSSCEREPASLLGDALRIGTRCGENARLGLDLHDLSAPPPDFLLTLVKGRAPLGKESAPRHTLELRHGGQLRVIYSREHGVIEGLTSERLLAALHTRLLRLGWFERSESGRERCNHDDERGDVFRLRAGGRERAVRDREGCRGGFSADELAELRLAIERVGAIAALRDALVPSASEHAQVWVVALDERK